MVGLDKPLARIRVSSLTCGSVKQAFCPNVRLKAWHGGARQTFGPNLGFKFDMRERKTSVLPQCKVVGLDKRLARIWVSSLTSGSAKQAFGPNVRLKAWHGGAIDKPLARIWVSSLTRGSAKQAFCPNVRLNVWHGGAARQTFGPNLGFKFDMRERKTSVLPQCKVEGLAWWWG